MNRTPLLACLSLAATVIAPAQQISDHLQTAGQVVVHRNDRLTPGSGWSDALKGAVTLPAGGDLAVSFSCAGGFANGSRVGFQLVVDNVALSSIDAFRGVGASRGMTYDFFAPGLAAGTHEVRIRTIMLAGNGTLSTRSMALRFATPDSPHLRLAHRRGIQVSRAAGGYVDVPTMSVDIDCPWNAQLQVSATGDWSGANSKVFIRALVDGIATKDVVASAGVSTGVRGHTFTIDRLGTGRHTVKLQWASTAGSASVGSPTLSLTAVPDYINYETGFLHQSPPSGPNLNTNSTAFAPVPGLGGQFWVPSRSDLVIRVGAEAAATAGTYFRLRCLVDGQPAPDGADLYWLYGTGHADVATAETLFVVRNLERGSHTVSLEWASSTGSSLLLGDRTLTATAVIGQRPLLVTATESDRPQGYQYGGRFAGSVVDVVGGRRVFKPHVGDNLFRHQPGVADWFAEQARGHLHIVEAKVIGPNLKYLREDIYRQRANAFTEMKTEALRFADVEFDYSFYDRDGDGVVRPDELYGLVIFYQDTNFGEVRPIPPIATSDGVVLDYGGEGVATIYTPDFAQRWEFGIMDHELCHLLLGAGDMYEAGWDPTAPGPFSIMDEHGWNGHLDPLHKLKQGRWYEAYDMTSDRWITLPPVSAGGSLLKLRDPQSHGGEYFLVENRAGRSYNASLPGFGVAVWHCDEQRLPNWRTAVELEHASGPRNPVQWDKVLFAGTETGFDPRRDFWQLSAGANSRWHDGSPSGTGVWAIDRQANGDVRLFVDVPGPGVLAQFEASEVPVGPHGYASMRIRIVNTDFGPDTFNVSIQTTGLASWTSRGLPLGGYGTAILDLTVQPNAPGTQVVVTARGNSGASTSDTARLRFTLAAPASVSIGGSATLQLDYPEQQGRGYIMATSMGNSPGLTLPGGEFMPLNPDGLFFLSWSTPSVFQNFIGGLDAFGRATARFIVPSITQLRGIRFYFGYATVDGSSNFAATSNGVSILVQ